MRRDGGFPMVVRAVIGKFYLIENNITKQPLEIF
jgi:hypothetical protein